MTRPFPGLHACGARKLWISWDSPGACFNKEKNLSQDFPRLFNGKVFCWNETARWCFGGSKELRFLCLSAERVQWEAVNNKKWFIRIGRLWGLQGAGEKVSHPKNLAGYSFIIKGKAGKGWRWLSSSFLSRRHASIISSSPRLGGRIFLSLRGQAGNVMAQWK